MFFLQNNLSYEKEKCASNRKINVLAQNFVFETPFRHRGDYSGTPQEQVLYLYFACIYTTARK